MTVVTCKVTCVIVIISVKSAGIATVKRYVGGKSKVIVKKKVRHACCHRAKRK